MNGSAIRALPLDYSTQLDVALSMLITTADPAPENFMHGGSAIAT
jgi:hypothetical protein